MSAHRCVVLSILLALSAPLPGQDDAEAALRALLADYPHKLIFETDRDGNWELYVMNADGTSPVNLTRTPDIDEVYPKVSPDGRWLAFCADRVVDDVRRRDVYRMTLDGETRELVAEHARDPFWSPDGTELGFLPSEYPQRFDFAAWATEGLRIHSFATGETRSHPNPDLQHLYTPAFTNDGKWILATVHGGMGFSHAILAIAASGDDLFPLPMMGCRSDLAADGRTVSWGLGDYSLGLARLDFAGDRPTAEFLGQPVRNRSTEGQTYHADFSPDGRLLAYSCGPKDRSRSLWASVTPQCPGVVAEGWDLWVADVTGRNVRVRLTTDGRSNKEPEWLPAPRDGAPEPAQTGETKRER